MANDDDDDVEDGEDEEEEDDDDEEENELRNLVDALPAKIRQKVLSKGKANDDDSSEDEQEAEEEGWGRKKKAYYSADTTDLEIGQEFEDAKDEEEAAQVATITFPPTLAYLSSPIPHHLL
jgi:U3 small nucleolar RNA-associated protein 3